MGRRGAMLSSSARPTGDRFAARSSSSCKVGWTSFGRTELGWRRSATTLRRSWLISRNGMDHLSALSDVGSTTIKRYGILNTVIEEALGPNGKDPAVLADLQRYVTVTQASERFRGIPFPGTFMLDREGRVTARFFEDFYWERNTVSNLMLRVGGARTPVDAIKLRRSTRRGLIPATRAPLWALVFPSAVDVTPKRRHACLRSGSYRLPRITLNVKPQPHVRTMPVQYPASEVYHFKPLNDGCRSIRTVYSRLRWSRTRQRRRGKHSREERTVHRRHARVSSLR